MRIGQQRKKQLSTWVLVDFATKAMEYIRKKLTVGMVAGMAHLAVLKLQMNTPIPCMTVVYDTVSPVRQVIANSLSLV